jgi:hypothetical protein
MPNTKPSVSWTDAIGAATLTCLGYTFGNWTPDTDDVGESAVPVANSQTYFFAYRKDDLVSFAIAQIANSEVSLALRLKSWLVRGGTITIHANDSEGHTYTALVAPGTIPTFVMSDTTELEYTLSMAIAITAVT